MRRHSRRREQGYYHNNNPCLACICLHKHRDDAMHRFRFDRCAWQNPCLQSALTWTTAGLFHSPARPFLFYHHLRRFALPR